MAEPEELVQRFAGLGSVLLAQDSFVGVLERAVSTAAALVPACQWASVSIPQGAAVVTLASTSDLAVRVDQCQYDTDQGPCLAAVRDGTDYRIDEMDQDDRWPAFAPLAAAQGVTSSYSVPMRAQDNILGALNLYSGEGPFTERDQMLAVLVAAQTAAGLANVQAFQQALELADHLNQALESRDVIGQAKGIIMARQRCGADEAFEVLRRASQRLNRKLRDVAEQFVRSAQD